MEKFENNRIAVEVTTKPGCQVELHVHLNPLACQEAHKESVKTISQQVSLPGFRKGRAPEAMIKKNYSTSIEEEWRSIVVNTALRESILLTSIYPWNREQVTPPMIKKLSQEEGCELVFNFEREPVIPDVKREELSLKKEELKPVTEEAIDASIQQLKENHASFEECDEAIAEGSFCRIDVEELAENSLLKLLADHRLEIKADTPNNWLTKSLIGKKAGESAEVHKEPDEPDESFKTMHVRVTVKGVDKRILPDDETLLKQLKLDSMESLRAKTKERLEREETQRVEEALKDQLWNQIFEKYPLDLPSTLIQAEARSVLKEIIQEHEEEGQTKEQIMAQEKEIHQRALAVAFRRLHLFFIARKVAAHANRLPQEKEVQQRASDLMFWDCLAKGDVPSKQTTDPHTFSLYRNRAFASLLQEKAEEHLLDFT